MIINGEKVLEGVFKSLAISLITFGVTFLRNIGQETAKLNENMIKLKYEIMSLSDNQGNINKSLMEKIQLHNQRIIYIEQKIKRL